MGFVQVETTGQLGLAQRSVTLPFDNPNVGGNVLVVICGWEYTGLDPIGLVSQNGNQITSLPIQTSAGHRSQVSFVRTCKAGSESFQLNFPAPGGDDPSISIAEYSASDIQSLQPNAVGNGTTADAGSITIPNNATIVMLTDATQNTFAAGAGFVLRTLDGTHAPIRQAIEDGVFSGSCDPQTLLQDTAPWATTVLILAPASGKRETIANALFSLLAAATVNGAPAFQTAGRNAKIWTSSGPQPAMYLVHTGETLLQKQAFGLTKYTFHFEILIYLRADADPSSVPDTTINQMLDAVDAALRTTPPGEKQTLGGLVENAWIEGQVLIDPGILDQQVVVMIPVKVVCGL